jgi:hypothetical protein
MTQHSPIIQWLCLSVLLCFLLSGISSEAKEASKIPDTTASQNYARPPVPQKAQNKTPNSNPETTPDVKSGEATSPANLVAMVAKLAFDMNIETVKRIETFYSNTVQMFFFTISVFGILASVIGSIAIGRIVKSTAKMQTQETLKPYTEKYERTHSEFITKTEQVVSKYDAIKKGHELINKELENERKAYIKLRDDFEAFQKKAIANLHGLRSTMLAWYLACLSG